MRLSDVDLLILQEIAKSRNLVSAFELKEKLNKDYATVQKAGKRLIENGILEPEMGLNKRNAPKKSFKFTLYGFCKFYAETDWGGWGMNNTNYELAKIALKNWNHLHESIRWAYTLFEEIDSNKESIQKSLDKYMGSSSVDSTFIPKMFLFQLSITIGDSLKLSLDPHQTLVGQKPSKDRIEMNRFGLYLKISDMFVLIVGNGTWGITAEDVRRTIKNASNEGKETIEEMMEVKLSEYEVRKRIFELI